MLSNGIKCKIMSVVISGGAGNHKLTLILLQERGLMGLFIKQEILRPLSLLLSRSFLCVKGYVWFPIPPSFV